RTDPAVDGRGLSWWVSAYFAPERAALGVTDASRHGLPHAGRPATNRHGLVAVCLLVSAVSLAAPLSLRLGRVAGGAPARR
nr:hypothetical protein [Actinomycetota bacterium]